MSEKISLCDVLSTLNGLIKKCEYAIEQSNDKDFRDTLISSRNNFEKLQWNVYIINKQKGYYIPAAPAGNADVIEVKNAIS